MLVTGLLYFHRISDHRIAGTALKNLHLFESLCGEEFNKIVLTTTMWDEVDERTSYYRENELNTYWKAIIWLNAVHPSGAFYLAADLLRGAGTDTRRSEQAEGLLLQREVEDLGLRLNQTSFGQTLFITA